VDSLQLLYWSKLFHHVLKQASKCLSIRCISFQFLYHLLHEKMMKHCLHFQKILTLLADEAMAEMILLPDVTEKRGARLKQSG
jgi:hypothetical protein